MKIAGIVLAIWYLAVSTNIIFFAVDEIAPLTKTIDDKDFPCAEHNCCCKNAKDCKMHCCCFPKSKSTHSTEKNIKQNKLVKVSLLSSVECKGLGNKSTYKLDSFPPQLATSIIFIKTPSITLLKPFKPLSAYKDPPGKIPI